MAGPHGLKIPPVDEIDEAGALIVACTLLLPAVPFVLAAAAFAVRWCVEALGYCLIMGVAAASLWLLERLT